MTHRTKFPTPFEDPRVTLRTARQQGSTHGRPMPGGYFHHSGTWGPHGDGRMGCRYAIPAKSRHARGMMAEDDRRRNTWDVNA
jgi:hypothetical protein